MEKSKKYYLDLYDDLERIVETACEANECATCPLRGKTVFNKHCVKADVEFGFEDLIKEHFDNPPLLREEIKNGDVIWDDKNEEFIKIFHWKDNKFFYETFGSEIADDFRFEEGRYYRKEVKE